MANTFKNEQVRDVTNSGWSDIGTEVNSTTQRTIIGMTIANTTSAVIAVDENGEEVARENAELLGCRTVDSLLDVAKKAFS